MDIEEDEEAPILL
ncbi:hypothetical protein A2U01_0105385, partial [Trifolium medium]|nr:hypothetical protein [Trifolium medium]